MGAPGRTQQVAVLGCLGFVPSVLVAFSTFNLASSTYGALATATSAVFISIFGLLATYRLVPIVKQYTLRRGLSGFDINKKGSKAGEKKVPESLGLASGLVFLVCIVLFLTVPFHTAASGPAAVNYYAALATICFMMFLGFADDVLDIPWRVKLLLPALAALPLVVAYDGGTAILLPKVLRDLVGLKGVLELGILYHLYMVLLTVFCSNSINILAGVNGLEAGQTFIVACAVLCHNLWMLGGSVALKPELRDGHLFSAYLMLPLATTTLGLLLHNWYPSQVFVGDTFTYYAGVTFAVAGSLGHFSETLLLFLIPQVLNFVYSVPQLFKWVPCPRHRLPEFDPNTGLLKATPNWNLVNLALHLFGPCTEQALCIRLLVFQTVCCCAAFGVRYLLEGVYK